MKKGIIITSLVIIVAALAIVSYSFAKLAFSDESGENKIQTGTIMVTYSESEALSILSESGTADETAKISDNYFAFSVKGSATGKITLDYYIYMTPDTNNTLDPTAIKLYLTSVTDTNDSVESETEVETLKYITEYKKFDASKYQESTTSEDRLLHQDQFTFNNDNTIQTRNYRLRVWLDENYQVEPTNDNGTYTVDSKTFTFKINVASKNA